MIWDTMHTHQLSFKEDPFTHSSQFAPVTSTPISQLNSCIYVDLETSPFGGDQCTLYEFKLFLGTYWASQTSNGDWLREFPTDFWWFNPSPMIIQQIWNFTFDIVLYAWLEIRHEKTMPLQSASGTVVLLLQPTKAWGSDSQPCPHLKHCIQPCLDILP